MNNKISLKKKYSYDFYKLSGSEKYPVIEIMKKYQKKELKSNKNDIKKYHALIHERYTRLEVNGTVDGKPKFDSIRNSSPKIEEIRFSFNKVEHRIFISFYKPENKYILLHYIYGKKTSKTPKKDIKTAEKRMTDFIRGKEGK